MYELFLDAVSTRGKILLLCEDMTIWEEVIELAWNESSQLWAKVFSFLERFMVNSSELSSIYLVCGPGSFTGIRSICLFCNTLAYIYPNLLLYPLSFFDLYEHYPIIKQSSRRDVFVKMWKSATIEILTFPELSIQLQQYTEVYGSFDIWVCNQDHLILRENYIPWDVIARKELTAMKCIEPLYIKNPNIS